MTENTPMSIDPNAPISDEQAWRRVRHRREMNHTSVAEIGLITTAEHAASTHVPELHAIELAQLAYAAWRFEYGEGDDGEPS